jgi:hypothetical protein
MLSVISSVLDLAIEYIPVFFLVVLVADYTTKIAARKPHLKVQVELTWGEQEDHAISQPNTPVDSVESEAKFIPNAFIPNPDGFQDATPEEVALVEAHSAFITQYWAQQVEAMEEISDPWDLPSVPVQITPVVPLFCNPPHLLLLPAAKEPETLNWTTMTSLELRQVCEKSGIKWRNSHGKGKHLRKAEMIALFSA